MVCISRNYNAALLLSQRDTSRGWQSLPRFESAFSKGSCSGPRGVFDLQNHFAALLQKIREIRRTRLSTDEIGNGMVMREDNPPNSRQVFEEPRTLENRTTLRCQRHCQRSGWLGFFCRGGSRTALIDNQSDGRLATRPYNFSRKPHCVLRASGISPSPDLVPQPPSPPRGRGKLKQEVFVCPPRRSPGTSRNISPNGAQ